ncbi:MAG: hypothetical protein ACJ8FY_13510 [Gemmataceae bacterium]
MTGLLLERGLPVPAIVRREDDRSAALRAAVLGLSAEVLTSKRLSLPKIDYFGQVRDVGPDMLHRDRS